MILLHAAEVSGTGNPAIAALNFTPVDCTGLTKKNGILRLDIKASNPTILTDSNQLELGSAGHSDEEEWGFVLSNAYISTAYQTFDFVLWASDTAGGELVVNQIDWIRWYNYTTGANVTIYWRNAYISFSNIYPRIIMC